MPGDTKAKHPRGLGITFTEEDHSYVDEYGVEYTSGTTLVQRDSLELSGRGGCACCGDERQGIHRSGE